MTRSRWAHGGIRSRAEATRPSMGSMWCWIGTGGISREKGTEKELKFASNRVLIWRFAPGGGTAA